MPDPINFGRRRFLGATALTAAAAELGLIGSADARSGTVPAITLEGDANGAPHPNASTYAKKFSGKYSHQTIKGGIGHNLPQEAPQAFAMAVMEVDGY